MADDFERIKGNVQKMLAQNAPDEDLQQYLDTERLSPDEFAMVARGEISLGSIRMTQKSEGEISKVKSQGQTFPDEGIGRGSMLPFSKVMKTGEVYFDPDAGLLGSIKRAAMLPGDVAMGKLDPNTDEGARRMAEFALSAAPTGVAARTSEKAIPGTLKALRLGEKKVPTAQELKAAGSVGFDEARGLGVDYSPAAVKSMLDDLTRSLESEGFNDKTVPKTVSILADAKAAPVVEDGATVLTSLDNLISLRKSLQKAAASSDASERAAASRGIDALDNYISEADPQGVVAGPASAAGDVLGTARANYAAGSRAQSVTAAVDKAQRNAAKSGSGTNLDNAIRQRLDKLLDKDARGFSPQEVKALRGVVDGSKGTNTARNIGKLGSGGLMTTAGAGLGATLGNLLGGPAGAMVGATAVPAVGVTSRAIAEQMTKAGAKRLEELLRKRSPLYQNAETPITSGANADVRALLVRLGLLPSIAPEGQR